MTVQRISRFKLEWQSTIPILWVDPKVYLILSIRAALRYRNEIIFNGKLLNIVNIVR